MKSYLKKFISVVIAMLTLFNMFGCSSNQIDQEKIAADMEIILTQIFDLIKNGDKETFKTYFADDALSESGTDKPFSHLETVCRTTFSFIASSSCDSPLDFLISFMFSLNIRFDLLSSSP